MEFDFYLIRILSAFLCGALLSLSGSLTQHATQNSIAGPSTLGFDGVAVICVIAAHVLTLFISLTIKQELLGILCFLPILGLFLCLKKVFKKREKEIDIKTYVLIGLCFNLFVGAIFSIIQFLFMALNLEFPTGLWFGNFRFVSMDSFITILVSFIAIYFWAFKIVKKLRLLSLGDGLVQNIGINSLKVQREALLISLLATVIVINLFGVFSFLSLIFPLSLRSTRFFRLSLKKEILIGSLLSGVVLSGIDFFCYNYSFQGIEFPVGMMSSVFGAFLLMALLFSSMNKRTTN